MCVLSNFDAKIYMLEILQYNYWEHIKTEKDLARMLSPDHPRRVELNESANQILSKIKELTS